MPKPPPPKSSPNSSIVKPPAPKSNLGKQLLRRLLEDQDSVALFELVTETLFPDEIKIYEWVKKFFRTHKVLPSVEVVASNGFLLPEADSPLEYYLKRVHDRAINGAILTRQDALATAMAEQDMEKAVQTLRDTLSAITALKNPNSYTTIKAIAKKVREDYEIAKFTPGLIGVTTGYPTLDEMTTGLLPGDLGVIVARPGMGKTYTLLKMAHAAWKAGKRVAIITMEMINEALVRRWIGVDASLNPKLIRKGELDIHGEKIFNATIDGYENADNAYFMAGNFAKSTAAVEEMLIQLDPDAIYIDGGYLLSPTDKRNADNGAQLAKKVINELKQTFVNFKKPGAVTVQFNRNAPRPTKAFDKGTRLDLADIGGTDAVGQDADWILGLKIPPAPYSNTHRIIETMKIREGEAVDFATDFNFWPMKFGEVPLESIIAMDDEVTEADEQFVNKPSWMLK